MLKKNHRPLIISLVVLIFIIGAGFTIKTNLKTGLRVPKTVTIKPKVETILGSQTTQATGSATSRAYFIARVSKHILLPDDEEPTLVEIKESDLKQLRKQEFFRNAKSGDIIVIYLKAKKAILYDPKADRLIEVGPIAIPTPTPITPSGNTSPTAEITQFPRPTLPPF